MNDSYIKPDIRDVRRQQLIDATIAAFGRRGYAKITLADVSNKAGLSRGIVNFHFKTKDKLLLTTLQSLADEYTAFWAEAWSRRSYRTLCTELDVEYSEAVRPLCQRIIDDGNDDGVDAKTIARGLTAMMSGLWHDLAMNQKSFDRNEAKRTCRAFLAAVFPDEFRPRLGESRVDGAAESDGDKPPVRRRSFKGNGATLDFSVETLPAWTYDNAELCELEKEAFLDKLAPDKPSRLERHKALAATGSNVELPA